MTIFVEDEVKSEWPFNVDKQVKKVVTKTLEFMEFEFDVELSVMIVPEDIIRQINLETRNVDSVTDVLSFPMISYIKPLDPSEELNENSSAFNPDTGELVLGDIVLCDARIRQQSIEFGHSLEREFSFLIVHSILHLMGYDHIEDEEREIMEQKQNEIMEYLKIKR